MPHRNISAEEIGANIRSIRKRRRLTLQQTADMMEEAGSPCSESQLSKWESGKQSISFQQAITLSSVLACSVNTLLRTDDEQEDRLHTEVMTLPESEKDILLYAITKWDGDVHALIRFSALYMCLPPWRRSNCISAALSEYEQALSNREAIDAEVPIDMRYILRQWKHLE